MHKLIAVLLKLIAQCLLASTGMSYLSDTIDWLKMAIRLIVTETTGNTLMAKDIVASGSATKFSLIMSLGSVVLAAYAIYTSIRPSRCATRYLLWISACASLGFMILWYSVGSSISPAEQEILEGLRKGQIKFRWDSRQEQSEQGLAATNDWNLVQESLHCCGYKSPKDWRGLVPAESPKDALPASCCIDVMDRATGRCHESLPHWLTGCSKAIDELVSGLLGLFRWNVIYNSIFALLAITIIVFRETACEMEVDGKMCADRNRMTNRRWMFHRVPSSPPDE